MDYSVSTLSWQVKNASNLAVLHAIVMRLALINCVHEGACHKGVTEAWESTETKNELHFESHTFRIFCNLAHPAAFSSAFRNVAIHTRLRVFFYAMQVRNSALGIPQIQC